MIMDEEIIEKYQQGGYCPVRDVIAGLSDKWSLLTVITLSKTDKMRFGELQKSLTGISQRMLTVTLRSLERDGLINRNVFPEVPPRVEYHLTPLGMSLLPALQGLVTWALDNMDVIFEKREAFDL
jgi:DNA-binding HxlR family transcriptional regulator